MIKKSIKGCVIDKWVIEECRVLIGSKKLVEKTVEHESNMREIGQLGKPFSNI
jgi:hypothetical protein